MRDPHAPAEGDEPVGDEERLRERHDEPVGEGHGDGVSVRGRRREEHDELVAAEPGHQVVVAADGTQPVGDLHQDAVAGCVAEGSLTPLKPSRSSSTTVAAWPATRECAVNWARCPGRSAGR